ncbi:hypothetical protein IWQ61_002135 [Dispira simplex]|nr:hypothetical protein IWQ61_002135 [Dispira simplex]
MQLSKVFATLAVTSVAVYALPQGSSEDDQLSVFNCIQACDGKVGVEATTCHTDCLSGNADSGEDTAAAEDTQETGDGEASATDENSEATTDDATVENSESTADDAANETNDVTDNTDSATSTSADSVSEETSSDIDNSNGDEPIDSSDATGMSHVGWSLAMLTPAMVAFYMQ